MSRTRRWKVTPTKAMEFHTHMSRGGVCFRAHERSVSQCLGCVGLQESSGHPSSVTLHWSSEPRRWNVLLFGLVQLLGFRGVVKEEPVVVVGGNTCVDWFGCRTSSRFTIPRSAQSSSRSNSFSECRPGSQPNQWVSRCLRGFGSSPVWALLIYLHTESLVAIDANRCSHSWNLNFNHPQGSYDSKRKKDRFIALYIIFVSRALRVYSWWY